MWQYISLIGFKNVMNAIIDVTIWKNKTIIYSIPGVILSSHKLYGNIKKLNNRYLKSIYKYI